jgi:hypothetical protein
MPLSPASNIPAGDDNWGRRWFRLAPAHAGTLTGRQIKSGD